MDETALIEEVLETLAGLTEAMNAHDPDEVFRFYRQTDDFFYLGCTDILYGWGTFAVRVEPYYTFNTDVSFEKEVLSVQILSPTVAVAALRGSSTEAEALFWTEVLQKGEDGRWLITHEHESWPGCPVPRGAHMGTTGAAGFMAPDSGGEPVG
jgi:ketosteroid isomerase-like protein